MDPGKAIASGRGHGLTDLSYDLILLIADNIPFHQVKLFKLVCKAFWRAGAVVERHILLIRDLPGSLGFRGRASWRPIREIRFYPKPQDHHTYRSFIHGWIDREDTDPPLLGLEKMRAGKISAIHSYAASKDALFWTPKLLDWFPGITRLTIKIPVEEIDPSVYSYDWTAFDKFAVTTSLRYLHAELVPANVRTRILRTSPEMMAIWGLVCQNYHRLETLMLYLCDQLHPHRSETLFSLVTPRDVSRRAIDYRRDLEFAFPRSPKFPQKPFKLKHLEYGWIMTCHQTKVSNCMARLFEPTILESLSVCDCPEADKLLVRVAPSLYSLKAIRLCRSASVKNIQKVLWSLPTIRLKVIHIVTWKSHNGSILDFRSLRRHTKLEVLWLELSNLDYKRRGLESELYFWPKLTELAISVWQPYVDWLKFPDSLQYLRFLHTSSAYDSRRYQREQTQNLVERLINMKPGLGLKALAVGGPYCTEHLQDHPNIYTFKQEISSEGPAHGAGKVTFEKISAQEFDVLHPDCCIIAGEEKGAGKWRGEFI